MGFSNMMIAAARSIPKSTMTQSMPSFTYSSCSTTNMWWLKNCCSFSLTKLMEICSKPLYSKISNPAMSSTAQKLDFLREASMRVVTLDDKPLEHTIVDTPGNTTYSVGGLLAGLTLGHPLSTDLDAGLAEGLDHVEGINAAECSGLARVGVRAHLLALGLVIAALGLELNTTKCHDTRSQHVAVPLLLLAESKHIEGVLSVLQLFVVVNGVDLGLALGHVDVVVDVVGQTALLLQTLSNSVTILLNQLVEDVV